ncbi:MAG: hypothetical protein JKY37_26675 [Nannocystaceae bacterium]|nr:hypothetical protein [Nannocystaceae bacterium]
MTRTIIQATACAAVLLVGCDRDAQDRVSERGGALNDPSNPAKAHGCDAPVGDAARNDEIRLALEVNCAGCHLTGPTGYFASLKAFQNLLVANPRLVVPGDPDTSELFRLLQGDGTGSSAQMPLGMESFADLDQRGATDVTLEEIRDWIADLEVNGVATTSPDYEAITVRKVSAGNIEFGLRDLLGLTRDDFFSDASSYSVFVDAQRRRGDYPIHNPDAVPGSFHVDPINNFYALGGTSPIRAVAGDPNFTPPLVQVLVPLSRRWCTMAVDKETNPSLFRHATAVTGMEELQSVRDNIEFQYLHFLGREANESDIDEVVDHVFAPLLAENEDPTIAWAGVCSYFVRHPQFLLF